MKKFAKQRGLTLVEVLVAMVVLSFTAGAVLTLIGQSSRFASVAENKMLARTVADNAMVETLSYSRPLAVGRETAEENFADRAWLSEITIVDTGVEFVYRIEITVRAKSDPQVLARVVTLKGEGS